MKQIKFYGVASLVVLVGVVAPGAVFATEQAGGGKLLAQSSGSAQTPASANDTDKARRIANNKLTTKMALTKAQATAIEGRCKGAQTKVQQVEVKLDQIESNRERIYGQVLARYSQLGERLQATTPEAVDYKSEVVLLRTAIVGYKNNFATYKTAVSDLASMDCASDPVGFKATLEVVRGLRQQLLADTGSINQQSGKVSDALKKIKAEG